MANCDWTVPLGSHRRCGLPSNLIVETPDDHTDLPLCPTHLVDYLAIHGPQTVKGVPPGDSHG